MTGTTTRRRGGIVALALAMSLGLAACGSDDGDAATDTGTMAETTEPMTEDTDMATPTDEMTEEMTDDPMAMGEPFGPGCAAVPADGAGSFDGMSTDPVATAASNNPLLSQLVAAVGEAGLGDTLNTTEDITVFAPTDDAFAAVPQETLDAAFADPSGLLTTVLTNHVVPERLSPDMLAGDHETLAGTTITVEGSGEEFTVGEAAIVCGNVQTANATVYIIDQVLLP
ncbi:fasciclin domain-containing protein [Nostocoides sp. F2B08]|uniref:fasciclin domain-containing protein n=1 Tax=Nostocoides sp. F2B08 TaxID=2653936 RepID=UPI001262F693|nr:fasciclin domain-containing protein [Tetrasphaera sp. F2B08]KAB7745143.1 fasciclin domain-containing protein [Tetrasphaera sp. F2B08]